MAIKQVCESYLGLSNTQTTPPKYKKALRIKTYQDKIAANKYTTEVLITENIMGRLAKSRLKADEQLKSTKLDGNTSNP